jgi:hypothetical protein
VRLSIEGPPHKELLRNISHIEVEARRPAIDEWFAPIDTIQSTRIVPSYVASPAGHVNRLMTQPRFLSGTAYAIRLAVKYHSGVTQVSSFQYFQTRPAKGVVVRSYAPPKSVDLIDDEYFFGMKLGASGGPLLVSIDEYAFIIDTSTGVVSSPIRMICRPIGDQSSFHRPGQ